MRPVRGGVIVRMCPHRVSVAVMSVRRGVPCVRVVAVDNVAGGMRVHGQEVALGTAHTAAPGVLHGIFITWGRVPLPRNAKISALLICGEVGGKEGGTEGCRRGALA